MSAVMYSKRRHPVHSIVHSTTTRSNPDNAAVNSSTDRGSLHANIRFLYGEDISKKTRQFGNIRQKISNSLARLTFLKRCRDSNITPSFVTLKHHTKNKHITNILHEASLKILRDHIRQTKSALAQLNSQAYDLHSTLATTINHLYWNNINNMISHHAERTLQLASEKLNKKFSKLHVTQVPPTPELPTEKLIINMTDESLDDTTVSVLKKGLNFAITPKHLPIEDIICNVELAITHLPSEQAEDIRHDISYILRKSKPPKQNITSSELKALRELRNNEDILITPADKGNATVLLKTSDYNAKMNDLLSDPTYKRIRNPTNRIKTKTNKLIKASTIPLEQHRFLITSDPVPPKIYGLPKIHKHNIPLRPIVSAIGSPTHKIARYLAKLIQPHVGNTDTYVRDSRHFIEIIKTLKLAETDLLVSFDVSSLFTKVPLQEIATKLNQILSPDLAELALHCLNSTYFYFNGQFYEQTEGAAMGSPLSPVIANLYMEQFEEEALSSSPFKPTIFLRYVDDTFIIWPHGRDTLHLFLNHLNSIHTNIQFTMEIEENGKLPFLDVLITRQVDGTLGYGVYRKPTHTDRYLHENSHHHPSQKQAVLHTIIHRAITNSDEANFPQEKEHVIEKLRQNGYTRSNILRVFRQQLRKIHNHSSPLEQKEDEKLPTVFLPFVKGTTDKISRIFNKYNFKTIFKPNKQIKQILRPIKHKRHLETPGVYHISCSCGICYIGESRRLISTRVKEHIRCTKKLDTEISAVAKHSTETKHLINFEETKILAAIEHNFGRKLREAIEIKKHPNNMNLDTGLHISELWKPVLNKLPKCKNTDTNFPIGSRGLVTNENAVTSSGQQHTSGRRPSTSQPHHGYHLRNRDIRKN